MPSHLHRSIVSLKGSVPQGSALSKKERSAVRNDSISPLRQILSEEMLGESPEPFQEPAENVYQSGMKLESGAKRPESHYD